MARPAFAYGFEGADLYGFTTQGTAPTATTGSKRSNSGSYGLDVNAGSGVQSSVSLVPNFSSTVPTMFYYCAMNPVTIPTTKRVICRFHSPTAGAANVEIALGSDGKLVLQSNGGGTVFATGSTVLSAGTWYEIEFGQDLRGSTPQYAVRVNGVTDIDWTSCASGSVSAPTVFVMGFVDTVAAAGRLYLDDICGDHEEWVTHARVKRLNLSAVASDNANWTLNTGSDKVAAINETSADDDTTYLISPANTTDTITYDIEDPPTDMIGIKAVWARFRVKRNGASNGLLAPVWVGGAYTLSLNSVSSTSAYAENLDTGESARGCTTHPCWERTALTALQLRLRASSTNQTRITRVYIEVSYSDYAGSDTDVARREFMAGMGAGAEEFSWTNSGGSSGGVTFPSHPVQTTPGYAALLSPRAGTAATLSFTPPADWSFATGNRKRYFLKFDLYVTAFPSSAQNIFGSNGTTFNLRLHNDGGLSLVDATGTSATSPPAILASTLHNVQIEWQIASGASATDGYVKVYVDGVLVLAQINIRPGSSTASLYRFGTTSTTTSYDVYISNVVLDSCALPARDVVVAYLLPTGAGATAGAGWTATGEASTWQCLDDALGSANDGDTSYVLSPASTTEVQSYQTADLPVLASTINGAVLVVLYKGNAGSTILLADLLIAGNRAFRTPAVSTGTTSYNSQGVNQPVAMGRGRWTISLMNAAELALRASSATQASRTTRLFLMVDYTVRTQSASRNKAIAGSVG